MYFGPAEFLCENGNDLNITEFLGENGGNLNLRYSIDGPSQSDPLTLQ